MPKNKVQPPGKGRLKPQLAPPVHNSGGVFGVCVFSCVCGYVLGGGCIKYLELWVVFFILWKLVSFFS